MKKFVITSLATKPKLAIVIVDYRSPSRGEVQVAVEYSALSPVPTLMS